MGFLAIPFCVSPFTTAFRRQKLFHSKHTHTHKQTTAKIDEYQAKINVISQTVFTGCFEQFWAICLAPNLGKRILADSDLVIVRDT